MGTAIGWLIARGFSEKWARVALTAALFLLALGTCAGLVALYNRHVIATNNQKIEHRAAPATNKASDERATDAITNAKQEQEMHDVIAAQPDQPIAPTSHARGCEQLRRAGRTPAACR